MSKIRPLKLGATYDDLAAVPENLVAETFDGELYASPRPSLSSGRWAVVATHEGGEPVRAEPFDAIELELGALWA